MFRVLRALLGEPGRAKKGGASVKIIRQLAILFALCFVSLCIEKILPIPFPASVIAMILLLVLLFTKVIRPAQIQETSDFLMVILQMLFIPAAASIMNYVGVIRDNFVPLVVVCVVSLFVTFAATAYAVQLTMHLMAKRQGKGEKRDA